MLKQIFRTQTLTYATEGKASPFGWYSPIEGSSYEEKLSSLKGLIVVPEATLYGPNRIFLLCGMQVSWWPGWGFNSYVFDSVTGKLLASPSASSGIPGLLIGGIIRSRAGKYYWYHNWGFLVESSFLQTGWSWGTGATLDGAHFGEFALGGAMAIDEYADRFIMARFGDFMVYELGSGKKLYTLTMPDSVAAVCLEDSSRCYVLCGNRVLLLIDYVRKEVLGATKVPTLQDESKTYWNNSDVNIAWDWLYRRLLVAEKTPDSSNGASTTYIRGFRAVPWPIRLTKPVPLRAPRKYRTVPVLTQVVGDMNEGVGGFIITSKVSGDGKLVGVPYTDNQGRGFSKIACGGTDYSLLPSESYDPGATGLLAPVIGRSMYFGYFFQFSERYGDNTNAPGNITFIEDVSKVDIAIAAGMKLVVTPAAASACVGKEADVAGIWASGGSVSDLAAQAAAARAAVPVSLQSHPIVGCYDGGQGMPYGPVAGVDWMALECYTGASETAAQMKARVQASIDTMGGIAILLIGQSYTSNTNNTQDPQTLIDTQKVPAELAIANSNVVAIMMFSDGRPTGTRDHEQWRPIHQAIFDGMSAINPIETPPTDIYVAPGTVRIVCSIPVPKVPAITIPGALSPTINTPTGVDPLAPPPAYDTGDDGGGGGTYPVLPDDVYDTLVIERGKFGSGCTNEEAGIILIRTAYVHRANGWGVNRKDGGNHAETVVGNIAVDILHSQNDNLIYDCLGDAGGGGPTSPQKGEALGPPPSEDRVWVAPVEIP